MKIKKILLFIFFGCGQIAWGHEVIMATSEDIKEFDKMIAQQKSRKSDIQMSHKIKTNGSGNINASSNAKFMSDDDEKNSPRPSQNQSGKNPQVTPVGEPHHGGKQHHN